MVFQIRALTIILTIHKFSLGEGLDGLASLREGGSRQTRLY